jgi:hypothetical protein
MLHDMSLNALQNTTFAYASLPCQYNYQTFTKVIKYQINISFSNNQLHIFLFEGKGKCFFSLIQEKDADFVVFFIYTRKRCKFIVFFTYT